MESALSAEQSSVLSETQIQNMIQEEGWFHGRWVINIPVPEPPVLHQSALCEAHFPLQLRPSHPRLGREQAESLLTCSGDFLVRESSSASGQYVLSGMEGDIVRHLLLVDAHGQVELGVFAFRGACTGRTGRPHVSLFCVFVCPGADP